MSKTNTWSNPSMLIVTGNWGPSKTFKLIPTTNDCPYVEGIFDPTGKVLAVIGNTVKDSFHMVPRLDDNGEPQTRKGIGSDKEPYKKQRVTLPTFQEYYIHGEEEIENFLNTFAVNVKDFDYKTYLTTPTMDAPTKVLAGPTAGQKSNLILEH